MKPPVFSRPELVAPAGDWPSLLTAVDNGADAVYFGLKELNMRHFAANFDLLELKKIMARLHEAGKKGYLALNTIVKDSELKKAARILAEARKADVDAVILWDMGVLSLAREAGLPVHLSTQAGVANAAAAAYYAGQGVRRTVLARECTLAEIRGIVRTLAKEKIPCEIEAFVHGAMCLSIAGRCFLSAFSFAQSANQGACLQPCRREYLVRETDGPATYVVGRDYVLSPKDLCTIDFIDELMAAGIHAFKIEGRMRPPEYVAAVTRVYREAIDRGGRAATAAVKRKWKQRLNEVYNRGFSDGFYFGEPADAVSRKREHLREKRYLGEVRKFYKKIRVAEIQVRQGPLTVGDTVLFIGKSLPLRQSRVREMQREHRDVKEAGKGQTVGVKVPFAVHPRDKVFLLARRGEADA